jgi:hypothetical protein
VGIAIKEDAYRQVAASLAGAGSKRLFSDDPAVMRCPSGLTELRVFLDSLFEVLDGSPEMLSHPTVQKTVHSALMGHLCDSLQDCQQHAGSTEYLPGTQGASSKRPEPMS